MVHFIRLILFFLLTFAAAQSWGFESITPQIYSYDADRHSLIGVILESDPLPLHYDDEQERYSYAGIMGTNATSRNHQARYLFASLGDFIVAKSVPNPGGRLGKQSTRDHIDSVATEMENRGWTITGGGNRLPEEYLPGAGGGRKGSSFPDITATKNGRTLRVNTMDTRADGITPSTREATNATRIRTQTPGDHLLLMPKP